VTTTGLRRCFQSYGAAFMECSYDPKYILVSYGLMFSCSSGADVNQSLSMKRL
jgi:hypothetical protein